MNKKDKPIHIYVLLKNTLSNLKISMNKICTFGNKNKTATT